MVDRMAAPSGRELASPGDANLMPTRSESPVAVSGTSQKMRQLLRQEAPSTGAGRLRIGELPRAGRRSSCHLVVNEFERTAGYRRPFRCRGVPGFPHS